MNPFMHGGGGILIDERKGSGNTEVDPEASNSQG
jgi:hypothetical protein